MAKTITQKQVKNLIAKIDRLNNNIRGLQPFDNPYLNKQIKIKGKVKTKYVEKHFIKLTEQHKKTKAKLEDLKLVVNYRRAKSLYNNKLNHGMEATRIYYTVTEKDIRFYTAERKKSLKNFTNLILNQVRSGKKPIGEDLANLKSAFKKVLKHRQIPVDKRKAIETLNKSFNNESLSNITRVAEDIRRYKLGLMTSKDELYYRNFLTSCLRVGAFDLYNMALREGFIFVEYLMAGGFFIDDLYYLFGTYTGDNWRASEEFENKHISFDDDNEYTFREINLKKNKSSDYGKAIYNEALERVHHGKKKYGINELLRGVKFNKFLKASSKIELLNPDIVKESWIKERERIKKMGRKRQRK